MGALHFLEPSITTHSQHRRNHRIELYEQGGQRYLKFTLDAGEETEQMFSCELTKAQTQALCDAATELLHRIAD